MVKSSQKDPTDSVNYRLTAVATRDSKLMEKVIYSRNERYLGTSPNQLGFKKTHSTDQCIYALNETINYYYILSTPLSACFLDIKSDYHRVSHNELFLKLVKRGAPRYMLVLLRYWYTSKRLLVECGTARSSGFAMTSDIRQESGISLYIYI